MSPENKHKPHSESKVMVQEVDRFVDGLAKAANVKLRVPCDFNRMCICGMGGSAVSGDIITDAVLTSWSIPVQVIRATDLPNWVDENTLIIASSYSGNTKETLLMYDQAKAKGCKIITITSGGEIRDRCLRDGNKLIEVPMNMQPRSAIGYTVGYLANIVETAGGPKLRSEILKLVPSLRKYRGSIWTRNQDSPAKRIAEKIRDTVPAVYADDSLSAVALRWKNQINENSKMIAFSGTIPELDHNEIVGWSECVMRTKCRPVILCEEHMPDSKKAMMDELTGFLRSAGLDPEIVLLSGRTVLEKSLKAIMLGDYVSLFLAMMNGVDPMDVGSITTFKQRLAMLLGRNKHGKKKPKEKEDKHPEKT